MPRRNTLRGSFGTIGPRRNRAGLITSLLARYPDPLNPKHLITKRFPVDARAVAEQWLVNEEKLVEAHLAGTATWTSPKDREQQQEKSNVLFKDYARDYLESYRAEDGSKLTEASLRKKENP